MEYSEKFSLRKSLKLRLRMSKRAGQEVPSQPREQPIMQRSGKHFYFKSKACANKGFKCLSC